MNSAPPGTAARAELRQAFNEIFDVGHMARAVLWPHWGRLPFAEQREFVSLFSDLLERLVVAHLRQLRWVTIVPAGEVVGERSAKVTWKIGTLRAGAVIEYRLQWRDGRWKIFDVLLNRQSFIAACREEFDQKIRASSFRALLAELPRRDHAGFVGPGLTLAPAVAQ